MSIPTTGFAVLAIIVLTVPALAYASVRRWAGGERSGDRDVGLSFARGIVFAVALSAFYAFLFGSVVSGLISISPTGEVAIKAPQLVGLAVLVLYVIVPLAISIAVHHSDIEWVGVSRGPSWIRLPRSKTGRSDIPTAWDFAASTRQNNWIRVTRADGSRLAGWYTGGSFMTSYPEPRSIYLDQQFEIDAAGTIGGPLPGQGFWITIQDSDIVEWIAPLKENEE
ncbi:DUF6338 family protein [Humibacter soli]